MENIYLTRVEFVAKQFRKIDQYKWYCRLMREHATSGFKVHGQSVPIYVAQKMAYAQVDDNFGMTEMQELLTALCNCAFLLNKKVPESPQQKEFKPKSKTTFDAGIIATIMKLELSIGRKIKSHYHSIETIRAMQKEVFKQTSYLNHRISKTNTFLEQNDTTHDNLSKKLRKKFNLLKLKEERARDLLEYKVDSISKEADHEEKLRKEINEKAASIQDKLKNKIKEALFQFYTDLRDTLTTLEDIDGYELVLKQLQRIDLEDIVEKLLKATSLTYVTPIPREFIKNAGFHEQIPPANYQKSNFNFQGYVGSKTSKIDKLHLFIDSGSEENNTDTSDCFYTRSGGVYVSPIQRGHNANTGIMNIKPGFQVKMKLTLMNGNVGFGWTRKNALSEKKWGFFFITHKNNNWQNQVIDPTENNTERNERITEVLQAKPEIVTAKENTESCARARDILPEPNEIQNDLLFPFELDFPVTDEL